MKHITAYTNLGSSAKKFVFEKFYEACRNKAQALADEEVIGQARGGKSPIVADIITNFLRSILRFMSR